MANKSSPVQVKATRSEAVGFWRRVLGLLATLLLGCSGDTSSGTTSGPAVRLHPMPVDPAATLADLAITALDPAGQATPRMTSFATGPFDAMAVSYPVGTRGTTTYQLTLSSAAGCPVAVGNSVVNLDDDRVYDVSVSMTATPNCGNSVTLSVQVANVLGGAGSVTSMPAGINCQSMGSGCSMVFAKGTPIVLHAQATTGGFSGWSGAGCPSSGDCSFMLTQDTQVQAVFSACHGWCKEQLPATVTANLNAITGTSAGDILIVGDAGTAVHWNGTAWQQLAPTSGTGVSLRAATAKFGGNTIYVGGDTGNILTLSGGTWTTITSPATNALRGAAVGAGATPSIFFIGDGGTGLVLPAGGTTATSQNLNTTLNLNGISQNPGNTRNDLFLGGAVNNGRGFAESWDGTDRGTVGQMTMNGSIPGNINAMVCGMNAHYAAGDGGHIVSRSSSKNNNNNWSAVATGLTTQILRGLWESADNNVFAVGDAGTMLQYDGTAWTTVQTMSTANLRAVWGSSKTNVYAVGDAGTVLHYIP